MTVLRSVARGVAKKRMKAIGMRRINKGFWRIWRQFVDYGKEKQDE